MLIFVCIDNLFDVNVLTLVQPPFGLFSVRFVLTNGFLLQL